MSIHADDDFSLKIALESELDGSSITNGYRPAEAVQRRRDLR